MGDADMSSSSSSPAAAAEKGQSTTSSTADARTAEETTKKLKLTDSEENGGGGVSAISSSTVASAENNNKEVALSPPTPPPDPEVAVTPDDAQSKDQAPPPEEEKEEAPRFNVQVMYNKNPLQLSVSLTTTVLELKQMIKERVGVDVHLQKVLLKGIAKDDAVLKDLGVTENTKKILVIGSSIQDVLKVKEVPSLDEKAEKDGGSGQADGANWCSATAHKKVIDKGLPDDVMPGILDEHDPLPPFPLSGMYSSKGSKVRLTFKLENDELWIGTKERTEKVPIGTIRNVTSQPITGYEHYHILAIQLGPTEASRFFVYWVPAQYVEAIKDALTGA